MRWKGKEEAGGEGKGMGRRDGKGMVREEGTCEEEVVESEGMGKMEIAK